MINCEDGLTQGMPNGSPLLTPFIVNPPADLPVSTEALFNSRTNHCFGGLPPRPATGGTRTRRPASASRTRPTVPGRERPRSWLGARPARPRTWPSTVPSLSAASSAFRPRAGSSVPPSSSLPATATIVSSGRLIPTARSHGSSSPGASRTCQARSSCRSARAGCLTAGSSRRRLLASRNREAGSRAWLGGSPSAVRRSGCPCDLPAWH